MHKPANGLALIAHSGVHLSVSHLLNSQKGFRRDEALVGAQGTKPPEARGGLASRAFGRSPEGPVGLRAAFQVGVKIKMRHYYILCYYKTC